MRGGRVPGAEIVRLLTWISRSAIWIGGAGILFSAGLVTVEITVRKFFGMSLGGADEVSGYIFAVSTMWALPFALLNRANVRIDVVYLRLPAWLRSFLDVFSLVLLVGFVAVVFWHSVNLFVENRANDTRSITPLQARVWIWQGLWILGMALFLLTGAVLFVLAVAALLLWRHDRVAGLIGSRSSEEEIASETAFLGESGGGTRPDGRRGV
ncbi:MAG: TRAP transporter small permease [Rhodospirillaceae bacterium]|nr:TRAP transporter small permease [Rhodospirillaceae bacterium]MDE0616686.1 TRAP transporter small permease [Rhodospirillaceae bacterium]